MNTEVKTTFCRLCEPLCGLVATIEDGRLQSLRPDPEHPLSQGQACPKGIAFTEIQNDPDRVLRPLRRRADDTFEPVSWDVALDGIATRLRRIWDTDGGEALGHYLGNPPAFSYSAPVWMGMFCQRLDVRHQFTTGSQDINSRFVSSKLLYGAASQLPFPDLPRTHFLLALGANMLVSHGSALKAPRIKEELRGIEHRGGRVVIVDPRRTETARAHEHLAVRPDGDAWLLLSLLHVLFTEDLVDRAAIAEQTTGADWLEQAVADFPPEATASDSGVAADVVRDLARSFAAAPSAVAYGRTGACLGRHGTLVNFLLDAINIVTGNLDRPGGMLFARGVVPLEEFAERAGMMTYGTTHSRVGGFPDVMGVFPASIMADEITTPGVGQLKALIVTGGNPVLTVPDGEKLAAALQKLELFVALDIYMNDTNRHADYILPTTTFLEREDLPNVLTAAAVTPFFQATDAVLAPYGEARQEWTIFEELLHRMGLAVNGRGTGILNRALLTLERRGFRITPSKLFDVALRLGPYGDRFGLRRRGLSIKRALRLHPHGVVLAPHAATGLRERAVRHPRGLVRLESGEIRSELAALGDRHPSGSEFPLRMIGMREMRSLNSWMHNSETLMKGTRRHSARINPKDAVAAGLVDGGMVRVISPRAEIVTEVTVTDDVGPGTVAVPHGWGHSGGGWRRANGAGGGNVNQLMSSEPEDLERLAGMALLNGIEVRLEPAGPAPGISAADTSA